MTRTYEEVIDFIAAGFAPAAVATFVPSEASLRRAAKLLRCEKTAGLSPRAGSNLVLMLVLTAAALGFGCAAPVKIDVTVSSIRNVSGNERVVPSAGHVYVILPAMDGITADNLQLRPLNGPPPPGHRIEYCDNGLTTTGTEVPR